MSAKPAKKSANKPAPATPPAGVALEAAAGAGSAAIAAEPASWMDSADPRRRLWGKIIFAGLWIYVAALWLLALDQTFHWGIFGPKVPPVP